MTAVRAYKGISMSKESSRIHLLIAKNTIYFLAVRARELLPHE
jgi:hypothetical protein